MKRYDADIEELIGTPVGADQGTVLEPVAPHGSGAAPQPQAFVGGAYDGANRFDRTIALWNPSRGSADGDILPNKGITDARARDSIRNDAYVGGGSTLHKDNIVGAQFLLNAKPNYEVLGLTEAWAEEFQKEVEAKFTLWAESPNNWVDASRKNTFTDLIRLAVGIYVSCGEVVASVEWLRDWSGVRPFNTAIQMIDTDRLRTPDTMIEGPLLRGGVERNIYGAPQGYYIQVAHPRDYMDPDAWRFKYVPARKPWGRIQLIHLFEQQRPDQSRGISEMVAALKEMRITKKFRDVVLQNAVLNATFAASIESELPTEAVYQAIGGGNMNDPGAAIAGYAEAYLGAIAEYAGSSKNTFLDGVRIPHLFPGTKLQLRPAGQGGPLGQEFEQSLLRYIAANLGVSYEQLSRDYTQTNYSSARAAMTETWKFMMSRKRVVADTFATHIYRLWFEEAVNKGEIKSMIGVAPSIYEGLNMDAYTSCDWIGAARGQIDELKETQAAVLRLKYNLTTYEQEMGKQGQDWRKVMQQRERENKEMEDRGLTIEEDTKQMNASTGAARDGGEARGEPEDGSGENAE